MQTPGSDDDVVRRGLDSVWKHGTDSTEDVWTAAVDGVKEIGETAKSVGDLAEGAWDALF